VKIDPITSYCGGRLLWGLWTNHIAPPRGWYEHIDKNWTTGNNKPGQDAYGSPDIWSAYCPSDLLLFQQILKNIMGNKIGRDQCAVLIAVTSNINQREGVRLLEGTGFKKAFTGRKNPYGNECTTWFGDMHGSVWPILSEVPSYEVSGTQKSGKFA
jgi:hypothetical protein